VAKIPPALRLPPWYLEGHDTGEWSWRECAVLCSENPQACDLWMLQEMDGERHCIMKKRTTGQTRAQEGVVGGHREANCTRESAPACASGDPPAAAATVAFCGRSAGDLLPGALAANGTRAGCDVAADTLTQLLVACGQNSARKVANALACAPATDDALASGNDHGTFFVGAAAKSACIKAGKTLGPALTRFSGDTSTNVIFSCDKVAGSGGALGLYVLAFRSARLLSSFCASGQRINPMLAAYAAGSFQCQP